MLAFFYKFMPEIISGGYLYKVYTPLYSLDDSEYPFVANKEEMVKVYHKKIAKNYKIFIGKSDKELSKDELKEFLKDTYEYRETLIRIAKDMGNVNKFLIESIIANMVLLGVVRSSNEYDEIEDTFNNQKFIKSFMNKVQKKFKEVTVKENQNISGVVDGKFCLIKVTNRFIRKTSDLIPIYQKYGYQIKVQEKGKNPVVMTIGEFLDDALKYTSRIIERFKGLGELDGDDLFKTALDINNRVSVQYTMDDVEKELEIFNMVHGPSKKDLEKRKEMMAKYKINRDDLDN